MFIFLFHYRKKTSLTLRRTVVVPRYISFRKNSHRRENVWDIMYQSLVSSQREAENNQDRSVPHRLFDQRVAATNVCGRFSPRIFFIRIPYNASFIRHPRYRRRLCLLIWISHRAVIIIAPVDILFISYLFWRLIKCATSQVSKNKMRETFS